MTNIMFPAFNINLSISRIAFTIGGIHIYWYAIFIAIAILIAIIALKKDCKKYNINYNDILELMIIVIPVAIICARLYYVIFNIQYYLDNPSEIINIRNGGLAIYGGIIGGAITTIIFCKIKKIKILDMFDMIVPYLSLGQAIGRWGNFINGEAHGATTNSIFRMGIIENGIYMEVHPTFLYESICTLIIFFILMYLRNHRKYAGQLTIVYLLLYSAIRTIIEGLRTDSLMVGNIRISQLISIIIFITVIIILVYKYKKKKEIKLLDEKIISLRTITNK